MSPEEIKALRTELKCTAKELAGALGLEQKTVLAWESGELFPTKRHVDVMETLRQKGPSAIPKKPKGKDPAPMAVLADPALWLLMRKLLVHRKLRDEVIKLAAEYGDPAETPPNG
jgi:transcriptional regulator with XRE-family HTH domain